MMKNNLLKRTVFPAALVLMLATLPACAQNSAAKDTPAQPLSNLGPNLVQNASFENGTAHWHLKGARVVTTAAHSGAHSLYDHRTNAKEYRLFTQQLDVKPGQFVVFSVWIKGKNITENSKHQGASVYVESFDGKKFIDGEYPGGFFGSFGWKKVSLAYRVPKSTTKTTVGLYMGHNVSGQVWFDDVSVRVRRPKYFRSYLQTPNYRGMVLVGNQAPWQIAIEPRSNQKSRDEDISINMVLANIKGQKLIAKTFAASENQKPTSIALAPPSALATGRYRLTLTYKNALGHIEQIDQHRIEVVKKMPPVYVDAQGFTVVDGKRFFPMGVYIGAYHTSEAPALKRISQSGFNTVLSYLYGTYGAKNRGLQAKAYMKNARKYGLKVIYNLASLYSGERNRGEEAYEIAAQYIKNLRHEPALIAWYINDEKAEGWMPKVEKRYAQLKRMDPNHLVFQVQNKIDQLRLDSFSTDVIGSDPYPVGSENLTKTSQRTKATVAAAHGVNGVWIVPQIMNWGVYRQNKPNHPPSLDEMRNQAYQAIINGAKGLIWYSYYDLLFTGYPRGKATMSRASFNKRWADVTAMAKEINKIIPVILKNHKIDLAVPSDSKVQAGAWQSGNKLLILLANPYYQQNSITFVPPQGWMVINKNQGEINASIAKGKITFTLPSVGSGVFKLVKK